MDELSGCGNVLYLLILHTETYLTTATVERKILRQLNFVLCSLDLDVSPGILQVDIRGLGNSSLTLQINLMY